MPKRVWIICGNAGVGKTTHATNLAREERALLLDIDTVAERLVRAGWEGMGHDPDDRDSPAYKRLYRQPIHDTLFAIARENLDVVPCVLVAPFTQERRDPKFLQNCQSLLRTAVTIHYVVCDERTRHARITARANPRDRYKLDNWGPYASSGHDVGLPAFEHRLIDTSDRS